MSNTRTAFFVKRHVRPKLKSVTCSFVTLSQGMIQALAAIHKQHGILGLWRGSSAAIPRVSVGSAAQLSTFSSSKEFVTDLQVSVCCFFAVVETQEGESNVNSPT